MKIWLHIFCVLLASITTGHAQNHSHGGGEQSRGNGFKGEVYGKVVDSVTTEPLEYVIVSLLDAEDSTQVAGKTTSSNGEFSLKVTKPGEFILKIDFIGYNTIYKPGLELNDKVASINVKTIAIAPTMMSEVEIRGDKPPISFEIDKKVINVDDQNTNVGQTAVEILENSPSVTVDSDGNVMLRGSSSFTLLINGVPTAMDASNALQSIPASNIENIEIITNPSAKYDAEGASGIINIILKKKKLEGVSMLTNLTAGTFENYSGDINLSIGKEDFTFNLSANYRSRQHPRDIDKERTTYTDSSVSQINSVGYGGWFTNSWGVNGEIQWEPNNKHTLIVGSDMNKRDMVPEYTLYFEEYKDSEIQDKYVNRQNNFIYIDGLTSSLFYQYKVKGRKDHTLTAKAINSLRYVDQLDSAMFYDYSGNLTGGNKYTEVGPSNFNRFDLDYSHPLKNGKLEMGSRVQLGYSSDDGKQYTYVDSLQDFVLNEQFSSFVEYTRDVYAGYAIYSGEHNKLGYQVGLRAEYTYRTIEAENFDPFTGVNRLDWFPSAHFSYTLSDKDQILMSYSRRIDRPRSWYFEPFITWETPFNVRTGNPDLLPEYINVFEVSFIRQFENQGYFSLEAYGRSTQNEIDRISTTYQPDVIVTRPYNIGTSIATGLEPSIQMEWKEWWEMNLSANLFYFNVKGEIEDAAYDRTSTNANVRLTNTLKFKDNWQVQIVKRYESPTATAQGRKVGFFVLDASVRRSFADGKYSLNLQGDNILGTRKNWEIIETSDLYLKRYNTPVFPMVRLTFSAKLNNYKRVMSRHEATDDF